jgi:hypothetical protein
VSETFAKKNLYLSKINIKKFLPWNDVLDGSGQDMSIVRQTCCKGGSVVEGELGFVLRLLQAGLERVQLGPKLQDLLLFSREVDGGGYRGSHFTNFIL